MYYIASSILLFALATIHATEEYIPDSHFEAVNTSLDGNLFTSRVSIQPLNDIVVPQDDSAYSPGKKYSFRVDEKFVTDVECSSIVSIASRSPNNGTIITINNHKSGGVHLSWINEKYFLCRTWIGRIVRLHFIFDCEGRAVVTCDLEYFDGHIRKQQRAESEAAIKLGE